MGNACFHEFIALGRETVLGVKAGRVELRMQAEPRDTALPGTVDEPLQQRGADTPAPPCCQHRHTADAAGISCFQQQPPGADRLASITCGQYMNANRIELIPFHLFGNVLLFDENGSTDGCQGGVRRAPGDFFNLEAEWHAVSRFK